MKILPTQLSTQELHRPIGETSPTQHTKKMPAQKEKWLDFHEYRKLSMASQGDDVGYINGNQWGTAGAGLLILSPDRKQVALFMRSEEVEDAGLWGIPGGARGKLKDGTLEDSLITSLSEAKEEIKCIPMGRLWNTPVKFTNPENGFEYDTFVVTLHVKDQFNPTLNWEHSEFQWKDIETAKSEVRVHPGVKFALNNLRNSSGKSSFADEASPWLEHSHEALEGVNTRTKFFLRNALNISDTPLFQKEE
jgi:8-oxo-dGTP pyrophosphatase MutT (NUDIX family)